MDDEDFDEDDVHVLDDIDKELAQVQLHENILHTEFFDEEESKPFAPRGPPRISRCSLDSISYLHSRKFKQVNLSPRSCSSAEK